MLDMVKKEIIPAVCSYIKDLSQGALNKKAISPDINCELEEKLISKLSSLSSCLYNKMDELDNALLGVKDYSDLGDCARYYREIVFSAMQSLRAVADEIEMLVGKDYWPYPTYGELLFSV